MNSIVNKRTMDFADFISEGFKIFFFRLRDYSLLTLVSIIPLSILIVFAGNASQTEGTEINTIKIILLCLVLVIQVIVSLITSISSSIITESIVENRYISLVDAIKSASTKWGRAFVTHLLFYLIIFGFTLLLFIPGVIYSIYYLFVFDAVALRNKYGNEALKYSKTLVEGQWWRIFWISVGIGITFSIINGAITFFIGNISENIYFEIVINAISLFIASIFGVVNTVLFLNIDFVHQKRIAKRKEMTSANRAKKTITQNKNTETITTKSPKIKKPVRKTNKVKTISKRKTV